MDLPVRTIVLRLPHGVVLISPGPRIKEHFQTITSFGEVTDIVAPNLFHHLNVPKAVTLWPKATLWGVEGFLQKRPDIAWTKTLTKEAWPYNNELPVFEIKGMPKANEIVFLHPQSRSLIVTDLVFNLIHQQGLAARVILGLFGNYRKFAVSRFFLKFVRDKKAFHSSIEQLFSLDFDNIILSHGENVIGNAKILLQKAFIERGFKV